MTMMACKAEEELKVVRQSNHALMQLNKYLITDAAARCSKKLSQESQILSIKSGEIGHAKMQTTDALNIDSQLTPTRLLY